MEQIASIDKLRKSLDAIQLAEDYSRLQGLITELHFAYESFRFRQGVPVLSDQRTLWDAAYYLLTALTNPERRTRLGDTDIEDGLAISGLTFELLGHYAEAQANQSLRKDCFINAAIANSLSRYEANSAVLARVHFNAGLLPQSVQDFLSRPADYGMNVVFALLGRKFFWLHRSKPTFLSLFDSPGEIHRALETPDRQYGEETAVWMLLCGAIVRFADFMIGGEEQAYRVARETLNSGRQIARDYELLSEHWLTSRLLDCLRRMEERSTWRVLRAQGFSNDYIPTLTRFPWNAVHELWQSQIDALTRVDTSDSLSENSIPSDNVDIPNMPENNGILSNNVKRVVVSMPTSAGKTLLAEMVIVRTLQRNAAAKCVYVAPTRALVDEIEAKLHRRLRFLGYHVTSVVGAFEIGAVENARLESADVAVLTPEKLDYLFRKRDPFVEHIEVLIFDEMHKVGEGYRGWFLETLISWLLLKPALSNAKMLFMSAVLPHSQQPLVRLWIGQESSAPLVSTNWSPTRQMISMLWYSQLRVDWRNPISRDRQGNRCFWGTSANLTFRYGIGTENRTLYRLYGLRFWVNDDYKAVARDEETRYDRCFKLIRFLGEDDSILVYFHQKIDLIRFCRRATQLEWVSSPNLQRLVQYISSRLGPDFPMVQSLPHGVAFHHGDLPIDVRNEIENAYRDKTIRVLACTTTLAEGVNLPIQTFILGYHQTPNRYRLSVRDFQNIIGRAGRALFETEGRIITIRHPEFSRGDEDETYFNALVSLDESKLTVRSGFPPSELEPDHVVDELNALAETITDARRLAQIDCAEALADEVQRLQVLIFTLFEDGIVAQTADSIESVLQRTLLFASDPNQDLHRAVRGLSQRFAAVCSGMESARLRRFNTSGLHYKSNIFLEELSERVSRRCAELTSERYTFEAVVSSEDLRFILEKIREARPRSSEYRGQYEVIRNLAHYEVLVDWIQGKEFAEIRDTYFQRIRDIATRTETCQSYISKQFTFRLPWAFAALHTHALRFDNPTLNVWLESIPALVKYGVDTPEAVYFSSAGIQSRFLARRLGRLYREEQGAMSSSNWQPLESWFLGLSPFELRTRADDLPDLAIRQAIRRANTIRRPSRELQNTGRVLFNIAGWQYYAGERFIDELLPASWGDDKPAVELQHEPRNEYDEYAVSIHWGAASPENKLGYVPRAYNEEIAVLLALGRALEARIITIGSPRRSGWRPVEVRVQLVTSGGTG